MGANAGKKLSQQTFPTTQQRLKNPAFLDLELLPQCFKTRFQRAIEVRIVLNEERDKLFYEKELQIFFSIPLHH